jgi:hypothetical protein
MNTIVVPGVVSSENLIRVCVKKPSPGGEGEIPRFIRPDRFHRSSVPVQPPPAGW